MHRTSLIFSLLSVILAGAETHIGSNGSVTNSPVATVAHLHINYSLSALEATAQLHEVTAAEERCALHRFAIVNESSTDPDVLTSLAECYAGGHVRGVPLSTDLAASYCDRASYERETQRLLKRPIGQTISPAVSVEQRPPSPPPLEHLCRTCSLHACVPCLVQGAAGDSLRKIRAAARGGRTGIPTIVAALREHPTHASIVKLAAIKLGEIDAIDPSQRTRTRAVIVASGALDLLALALDAFSSTYSRDVLMHVEALLGSLAMDAHAAHETEFARAAAAAGIIEPLVAAVGAHVQHRDAAGDAIAALLFICVGGQTSAVAAAGAIAPMVASIEDHFSDKVLLMGAGGIVSGILEQQSAGEARVGICTALSAARAINPMRFALSLHMSDPQIVSQVCNVIALLARHAAIDDAAIDALEEIVGPLTLALSRHINDFETADLISSAFQAFTENPRLAGVVAASSSAPSVLVAALKSLATPPLTAQHRRRPDDHARLKALARHCGALVNLAANDAGSTALAAAGVIPALTAVLLAHEGDVDMAEQVCGVFSNLARHVPLLRPIVRAGAVRPLVAALAAGAGNAGLVTSVSFTLGALSDVPEGRSQALDAGALGVLKKAEQLQGPASRAGSAASRCRLEMLADRA